MEEDIKILEELRNRLRNGISLGIVNEWNPNETFAQAIENLINRNKELEEEKQQVLDDYQDLGKDLANNFIPKSKIKEKIEELKEMDLDCETFGSMRNYAVLILQELLEKESK